LPEDIGGAVAFLCSDEARWVTGQYLPLNGGINTV
jgi:NAD(P)-dependent dehydrogenase (short-subunit alcohol dehydrogenase family)